MCQSTELRWTHTDTVRERRLLKPMSRVYTELFMLSSLTCSYYLLICYPYILLHISFSTVVTSTEPLHVCINNVYTVTAAKYLAGMFAVLQRVRFGLGWLGVGWKRVRWDGRK